MWGLGYFPVNIIRILKWETLMWGKVYILCQKIIDSEPLRCGFIIL